MTQQVGSTPARVHLPGGEGVDLTRPLRTALPIVPGDPGVRIERFATHSSHGYAMTELHLGSHSGTHMDAPFHFIPQGMTLDRYPVSRFMGPALVVDLRGLEPDSPIPVEAMAAAFERLGRPSAGQGAPGVDRGHDVFALLWLGWDVHFGAESMWRHPYLTEEGARWLVDHGVSLVGTDAPSVDRSAVMESFPAHVTLLGRDVLVVENLCRLEELGEGPAECLLMPLHIADADGAPVRAVAWAGWTDTAGTA